MLKKVIVGLFVALMIGAIVFGVIELANPSSHVLAREGREGTEQIAAQNQHGLGGGAQDRAAQGGRGSGSNGSGRGAGQDPLGTNRQETPQGRGAGAQGKQGAQPNAELAIDAADWETVAGTVVETVELVVETSDGQMVQIGLGPSHYRDSQGFAIQVGDQVQVSGYWEDGEFKAAQVDNLTAGTQIVLRDTSGRPMWSGRGRSG